MNLNAVHFRKYDCFKETWCGFDCFRPINVIIGRNNSGKSHLLDALGNLCDPKSRDRRTMLRCRGTVAELPLRTVFPTNHSDGPLPGNHWDDHGKELLNTTVEWEMQGANVLRVSPLPPIVGQLPDKAQRIAHARTELLTKALHEDKDHQFRSREFRRLYADRDIRTESPSNDVTLQFDGVGATNIIRRFLLTSHPNFPREVVKDTLLGALNEVFGKDGQFTELSVRVHDDATVVGKTDGHWEVYLGELSKGLIPLSGSGSGLKTVLLVLLNLLVIPKIRKKAPSDFIFAFEEIENNLHPALLRRLLQYLETYAVTKNTMIFLTTHSSTALDVFGVSPHAQIVHVTHNGTEARTVSIAAHLEQLSVIAELGARPSDLLQANGVIWVEGPSDRIYLNHWIALASEGALREGRDYQCASYAGALLAQVQYAPPDAAQDEFINLLRLNSNIIVVCDSDRTSAEGDGAQLKERVRRIVGEVNTIPGALSWVTDAKEIENYIPGDVLGAAFSIPDARSPERHERFHPGPQKQGTSYTESVLRRAYVDKIELALKSVPLMSLANMRERFDWEEKLTQIVRTIKAWNA